MTSAGAHGTGSPAQGTAAPSLDQLAHNVATSTRSLSAGLAGTCVAVLTFVLFFLYPRWTSGEINGLLFQWTLINIVATLFLMALASILYWMVMEAVAKNHPLTPRLDQTAGLSFMIGTVLLLLEPALILFTVAVDSAAVVALGFWFVVLAVLAFAQRWFR